MKKLIIFAVILISCGKTKTEEKPRSFYEQKIRQCKPDLLTTANGIIEKNIDVFKNSGFKIPLGNPLQNAISSILYRKTLESILFAGSEEKFNAKINGEWSAFKNCFDKTDCKSLAVCSMDFFGVRFINSISEQEKLRLINTYQPVPQENVLPDNIDSGLKPKPIDLKLESHDISQIPDGFKFEKSTGEYISFWTANVNSVFYNYYENKDINSRRVKFPMIPASPVVFKSKSGGVFVNGGKYIYAVDKKLLAHPVWKTKEGFKIGAATIHKNNILIASQGSLIILNAQFKEVSRVDFKLSRQKEGHDIIMNGDEAMILDNVVIPIFLFRVDISNPEKPVLLDRIQDMATWAHLKFQWLDTKSKRWAVLRTSSNRCGTTESILTMDIKTPASPVEHKSGRDHFMEKSDSILNIFTPWTYSSGHCNRFAVGFKKKFPMKRRKLIMRSKKHKHPEMISMPAIGDHRLDMEGTEDISDDEMGSNKRASPKKENEMKDKTTGYRFSSGTGNDSVHILASNSGGFFIGKYDLTAKGVFKPIYKFKENDIQDLRQALITDSGNIVIVYINKQVFYFSYLNEKYKKLKQFPINLKSPIFILAGF
ncbi:hypothetical protein KKF34_14385 [Myxococcota bacterium]|nr:hypothetical protein [Myxococcota bacterium]MBU1380710.1 hypothetical protein [Myxococcota bacterium]MBU1498062.1 hypothetical protein [Myxococcota bacterium]